MAVKVLFHLSMLFCAVQLCSASDSDIIGKLSEIRNEVTRSKQATKAILLDIERIRQTRDSKMFNIIQENIQKLYEIERTRGAEVEKTAQEMKTSGKNIAKLQKCVQSAKSALRANSVMGISRLNSCSSSAKEKASEEYNKLNVAVATGNHLVNQFQTIESRCSVGNIYRKQKCMMGHLRTANISLDLYEASSTSTRNQVKKEFEEAISWQNDCSKKHILEAENKGAKVIEDANRCLKSI